MIDIYNIGGIISTSAMGILTLFLLFGELVKQKNMKILADDSSIRSKRDRAKKRLENLDLQKKYVFFISGLLFFVGLVYQIIGTIY